MKRQTEAEFDALETAVTFGVGNALIPGALKARLKARSQVVTPPGAWARQMAADFPQAVAGASPDGPMAIGSVA